MNSRQIQVTLAIIFLALGGWALLMPGMVLGLVFREEYRIDTMASRLLMGCFGAQAVLTGTILALTSFSARGFLVFGIIGSAPFFAFNFYFYFVIPMFTSWMLLDFVGNISILMLCLWGRIQKLNETTALQKRPAQDFGNS